MTNFHIGFFLFSAILPGLVLAWLGVWFMRWIAPRVGLVDQPGARKVHTTPRPLGGGVGIWFGVVGTFATLYFVITAVSQDSTLAAKLPEWAIPHLPGMLSQFPRLSFLLGCGSTLAVLGLMDDARGLNWKLRLGVEFAVAIAAVTIGKVHLSAFIAIPWIGQILSVIWIVALINSFNMLDNMDGLSGGIAAISAFMLAIVLLLSPDPATAKPQLFVSGFLLVLVGSLLGFLWHNRPPARIFMGDAGSYFIGFNIAIATLLSTYANYSTHVHAVMTPLCVMAVPLYDMATVLWIRFREGRSLFVGDKSHFSHRLNDLGLTKVQAVLTIYLTTATCGLGALLLHRVDFVGATIVVFLVLCILGLIAILESTGRRKNDS